MEGGSARQRTMPCRPPPCSVGGLISAVLLLGSVVSVESPSPAWAAIYECRDATGKTVLTDRPKGLHNCEMRSKGTASALTPSDASPTPQVSPPPISSDRPSPPPDAPLPPPLPTDTQGASIGSHPAPNPGTSSSSSSPQPCSLGLNSLNPMSGPPCVPSNQSGTQPSGAPSAPSQ
jgi:hypothetical protein